MVKSYQQLCTPDELKLVRVTAQIDAPTIFLRLFGYPTVTLTDSAISQTAVIDVVLIFDVSESMLNETTYADWDTLSPKEGVIYMPPYIDWHTDTAAQKATWSDIVNSSQAALNPRITPLAQGGTVDPSLGDNTIAFEPTTANPGPSDYQVWNPSTSTTGRVEPRSFCQVRAYVPTVQGRSPVPAELRQTYYNFFTNVYAPTHPGETYAQQFGNEVPNDPNPTARFRGFVPMYNYFGCCDDPTGVQDANGNYDFGDLVCQPFKDARNAATEFLSRLDFLRGDRVGFVTFDRQAYLVDPDGTGPQAAMIETEHDLHDPNTGVLLRHGAVETLNSVIGVRADGTSYYDNNHDGKWDSLLDGGQALTYDQLMTREIGNLTDNPVRGACPYDKAVLDPPYLNSAGQTMPDDTTRPAGLALLDQIYSVPNWYANSPYNNSLARFRSYEFRASCNGTNTGGALAAGSAALYNEGRREGAVWIMVLLSDGAAGGSNPITKINGDAIAPPQPYTTVVTPGGKTVYDPLAGLGGPISGQHASGGYGAFGLCPYGTDTQPSQLLNGTDPATGSPTNHFPYCSGIDPSVRHFCGAVAVMPDAALDADPNCINYYDVDDYARDWADWVGLGELPGALTGGTTGRVNDQLLPTIFTIGFGINFTDGQGVSCATGDYNCERGQTAATTVTNPDTPDLRLDRASDYFGEELLRYIADVGDNFQIDSDYWQKQMSNNGESIISNGVDLTSSAPNWGQRGPCEEPWTGAANSPNRGDVYSPLPPKTSCGNYFHAASGAELQQVFNQIASKMFTRLSQ